MSPEEKKVRHLLTIAKRLRDERDRAVGRLVTARLEAKRLRAEVAGLRTQLAAADELLGAAMGAAAETSGGNRS
ncbi:MAG TPA: hypothetical protein VN238_05955 [Solirubrobacteraceae bacterium]|nr:hypothetical protein [Solirubrobacteraceae bacterium]